MKWSAQAAAQAAGGRVVQGRPERGARGISTDSRTLEPGQGFIALRGRRYDGHDFIRPAAGKGAAWIMVEKNVPRLPGGATVIEVEDTLEALGSLARTWRRKFKLRAAAVTGSVGKSTVKEMAAMVLGAKGRVLKNQGNLNNRIGLPLTLFELNRSHDLAVLEMGCNEPGEIGQLTAILEPQVGLITAVAPVHLEGLGSIPGVARAKAELIRGLAPGATLILNLDDPWICREARGFGGRIIAFTARPGSKFKGECLELQAVDKEVIAGRPRINFSIQLLRAGKAAGRPVRFSLGTLSRTAAVNALAACALARAFGIPLETAAERLRGFKGLPGRGEVIRSPRGAFIMDDTYNASPASVAAALETLAWWKGPMRGVAVLGEMLELGAYAEKYHRQIGKTAVQSGVELLLALGPHARDLVDGARKAGLSRTDAVAVQDNQEAAGLLGKRLRRGDWVLVKGSRAMGMESVVRALSRRG